VFEGLVDSITSALSSQVSSRPGGSGLMNSVLSTFGFGGGGGQARSGSGGAQGGGLFSSVLSSIFGGGGFQPSMTTPPYIPARAAGGMAFGTTLVGERGPELVNFTQPGMVFSNDRSRRMMQGLGQGIGAGPGGSGRQGQVFNIDNRKIINAAGADPAALKRVEERIDQFQSGEPERWLAYQNSYNRASR
jgi:PPE-repeat protein